MTKVAVWKGIRIALVALSLLLVRLESKGAILVVSNSNDSVPAIAWSLRQALIDSNVTNGLDTIIFQIPGGGVHTIMLSSNLPPVIDPVVIDGTSQPGFAGQPLIELNGSGAGPNAGLRLLAGNSTVWGLAIKHCGTDGIYVEGVGTNSIQANVISSNAQEGVFINGSSGNVLGGTDPTNRNVFAANGDAGIYVLNASGNVVQGNFIGTTVTGTSRLGNINNGIALYNSSANLIGGTTPGARNVVSGNSGSGIYLFGPFATENVVQGNYIGTDVTGTLAISNLADGVTLQAARNNTIGGSNAGAGNLISGNSLAGVYLNGAANNSVQANFIGPDVSGKVALGNRLAGITLSGAKSNLVGGTITAAQNVISGNKQDGIFITTNSTGNLVQGNFIGVDATGTNALRNLFNGISISSAGSNTVGGILAGARNIISGNAFYGIQIFNPGATANLIQGNYIGPDVTGRFALTNLLSGLRIESSANIIGGTSDGARNLISGNRQDGIYLVGAAAVGNFVQGNFIGTRVGGTNGLGNSRAGIGISGAPGNIIGGTISGAGNLLSANGDAGIYLIDSGTTGNQIQGNILGSDVTGTLALGNTFEGIYVDGAPSNTIGGAVAGAGNLISANNTRGIWLTNASWNVIQGNLIGTKADGMTGLGNRFHAVELEAAANNNLIGGTGGAGNRIGFSQTVYTGVRIRIGSTNSAILGNAIFSNAALGIDLGVAGATANDSCDADPGANMLQNFPVLTQAVTGSGMGIRGTLNSRASSTFFLQFFANPACDPSGYGEGQIYLGEKTIVTGSDCTANFVATLSSFVPVGYVVTATATDSANNTSEFSACAQVGSQPTLAISPSTNDEVSLTWTNTATGFVLKETESLSPPIQWTTVTNMPAMSNGQFVVTLAIGSGNRFYHLNFE